MSARGVITLVVLLGAGCGVAQHPLTVGVMTAGLDGMVPQAITTDSTLTAGAQGGFHVWLTLHLTGARPGLTRVKHTIRRQSDGVLFSTGERTLDVGAAAADGTWDSGPAWPAFLCPSPLGIDILGTPAVIKIELSTTEGTALGSGETKTQFSCPAAQQAFCESICKG